MESDLQIRMLTEILKELLDQVALSTRQEIAAALYPMTNPPEALINIMCEDVVEVSGPLLEKALLPDEKLIHIIRYGTEPHRIHISRRFGLSPLVRHELEDAYRESESSKLKYSLNELDKQAEEEAPVLDEETTANILELLRAQRIHSQFPEQTAINPAPIAEESPVDSPLAPTPATEPEMAEIKTAGTETVDTEIAPPPEDITDDHPHPVDISLQDASINTGLNTNVKTDNIFPTDTAANDAVLPGSTIKITDDSPQIDDGTQQQLQDACQETDRQRAFVRAAADWFWEVDRTGHLTFISEEAFYVFGQTSSPLIGEDFISLCTAKTTDNDSDNVEKTLESLFEHRSSFRNAPFYISSQNEGKTLWYISAIAIFDTHTGRFAGFRGSARAEANDDNLSVSTPPENSGQSQKDNNLEGYVTTQALKAVTQHVPQHDTQAIAQEAIAPEPMVQPSPVQETPAQKACNEDVAAELLQNLSHEFRTPLNAIIGFSEMIDMEAWGPVNPQYHANIKNILSAAVQLKEAVNDVLDSARLEAGLMEIAPESFSLKSVLKNCRDNIECMAREKDIQLMDNNNNIDVILYNDKQSVELCLTKMLASTIKRAHGNETIGPSVLINSNAQVRIELPVLGPRIKEENAEILFHKLQTGPDENETIPQNEIETTPQISSGYGLSIAQNLAHLIGGDISIHCTHGYITHLVLTLSNHDPVS